MVTVLKVNGVSWDLAPFEITRVKKSVITGEVTELCLSVPNSLCIKTDETFSVTRDGDKLILTDISGNKYTFNKVEG